MELRVSGVNATSPTLWLAYADGVPAEVADDIEKFGTTTSRQESPR